MPRTWTVCLGLACLAIGPPAHAELLYFAKGGEVQAPARVEGARVVVEAPGGLYVFHRSDFRKIVLGYCPEREWEARRQTAMSQGVEKRFAAVWWALENGLTPQAVALLREPLTGDASHPPTSRMRAALDRLSRPCPDPELERLERALAVRLEVAQGPHVVLLHQHTADEAGERVDLIERVVTTYYLMFASQGLELPAPGRKLATAWLADRGDYVAFLKSSNAEVFRSTQGYFHPTLNAVVAYDIRDSEEHRRSRAAIEARRDELDRARATLRRVSVVGRSPISAGSVSGPMTGDVEAESPLQRQERDLLRRQLLLELDRRAEDLGTAAHETVHQLVVASGLAPRHDAFPIWLHEGLASQFEVVRGGRWAGVGRANDLRLADWRRMTPPPALVPLIHDSSFGKGFRRDVYAQAWALVFFLRKEYPQPFLAYLDLLRAPTDQGSDPLAAFHDLFGADTAPLQASWRGYLRSLRTPLDEQRPAPSARSAESPAIRD